MTDTERLILKNQFAILEILSRAHPDAVRWGNVVEHDPESYRWYQRVLQGGYELLITEVTGQVHEVTLTQQEQEEILDILDMYRDIQDSYRELGDKTQIKESEILFPGWDGNSSKGELSFARTFCYRGDDNWIKEQDQPDRFGMIKPSPAHNSHAPLMGMYRRMLSVYTPLRERRLKAGRFVPLTADELRQVLDARTHPDYRR